LKHVLLDRSETAADSLAQVREWLRARLVEGHGEALIDLGLEDSGDSMGFSKEDWALALERLVEAAANETADLSILMTRNVGNDQFEEGPLNDKDQYFSGKVLVRQRPSSVNDVIETRIAVVGNGV
jgi:GTPase